ncbi:hypothetical protein A6A11_04720 [Bisgaardia hudsonensis]|nr:hypothetical protein A6A11_04720 [Bisgaardia hudsonensis]
MRWITAEITTPIRQMMIGDKGIQIYVKPEEWRKLRGITTIADPNSTLEWDDLIKGEDMDIIFPEFIEFNGIKYKASYIDKKTRIIHYRNKKYRELPYFWTLGTDYRLYYDPIIHKTIAISEDASGAYPNYLAGGGNSVGGIAKEDSNYNKLREYLRQNYTFN